MSHPLERGWRFGRPDVKLAMAPLPERDHDFIPPVDLVARLRMHCQSLTRSVLDSPLRIDCLR